MAAQSTTAAVTVVIPHYGDPAPTLALVDRLLTDPGDALAAVVVSDDASPTPYPEAHDPRLTVVRRERNGGFGANVNTGLAAVTTELALVLNSDAEITGAQIDALVVAAAPYQPAVVSPQVVNEDGTPQWSGRHFPTVLHQTVEWLTPLARFRHLDVLHEAVGHDIAVPRRVREQGGPCTLVLNVRQELDGGALLRIALVVQRIQERLDGTFADAPQCGSGLFGLLFGAALGLMHQRKRHGPVDFDEQAPIQGSPGVAQCHGQQLFLERLEGTAPQVYLHAEARRLGDQLFVGCRSHDATQ